MKSKLLTSMCVVTLIWAFSGVSFAQPTLNFTVLPADLADGPMSISSILLDVDCADIGIVYTSIDPYNNPRPAELREQIYNREDEFGILDIDSDGFLSMTEYNGPQQLFQDMDVNQDMKLSIEEARYMMTFADIPYGSFIMGTDDPIKAFLHLQKMEVQNMRLL